MYNWITDKMFIERILGTAQYKLQGGGLNSPHYKTGLTKAMSLGKSLPYGSYSLMDGEAIELPVFQVITSPEATPTFRPGNMSYTHRPGMSREEFFSDLDVKIKYIAGHENCRVANFINMEEATASLVALTTELLSTSKLEEGYVLDHAHSYVTKDFIEIVFWYRMSRGHYHGVLVAFDVAL